jgi:thiamine biosynthesis lipoprotein
MTPTIRQVRWRFRRGPRWPRRARFAVGGDEVDVVHHILDPRTGWSADPVWRTVSVAAQTRLAANTVSTAAIIRGWRALD